MNTDQDLTPIEETDTKKRTMILVSIGIVIFSVCALFTLAFFWFQPTQNTLFAKYFPSPTITRRPTSTPVPTKTPIPNLTATQLAWIKPSQSPILGTAEEAQKALESGMSYLEDFALVIPDTPEVNQPGDIYIYEIQLDQTETVLWSYGWCATTQHILEDNFDHMQIKFVINEKPMSLEHLFTQDTTREDRSPCRDFTTTLTQWTQGQHQLEVQIRFTDPIFDGWNFYSKGTHTFKYIVTVN